MDLVAILGALGVEVVILEDLKVDLTIRSKVLKHDVEALPRPL